MGQFLVGNQVVLEKMQQVSSPLGTPEKILVEEFGGKAGIVRCKECVTCGRIVESKGQRRVFPQFPKQYQIGFGFDNFRNALATILILLTNN